jgi:hypothetical protein
MWAMIAFNQQPQIFRSGLGKVGSAFLQKALMSAEFTNWR